MTGGSDLGILEIQTASQLITEAADKDANIIIGAIIDETLGDEIQVTVIATGFEGGNGVKREVKAPTVSSVSETTSFKPVSVAQNSEKGVFEQMREDMEAKKAEVKPTPFAETESNNLFRKFNTDDDGIDVPIFLRKNQD